MSDCVQKRSRVLSFLLSFSTVMYTVWTVLIATLCVVVSNNVWRVLFLCLWFVGVLAFACRPKSKLHSLAAVPFKWGKAIVTVLVAAITVAVCVLPMGGLPIWNGTNPEHRNQYELMTEAILDGHLYIEYGNEEELAQLNNPYDPDERDESGVSYQWDHAYYNGRYYMYFGVVPVFLAFLPYRVITGEPLTTFHATQLFVLLIIAGIFTLFYLLSKLFFKKLPYAVYLALAVSFSVMCVWYSIAEPALYCTAITAALALEIWSLFFFIKAVWGTEKENRQILYAAIGALLGALVFGCRPPIALANLVVIPMVAEFIRQRKFTASVFGKLVLAALPYALVAAALMTYNYVRFDNPFEFGQAYQLTVADQTQYSFTLNVDLFLRMINETLENFFSLAKVTKEFPFVIPGGIFFNFPILLLTAALFKTSVRKSLKDKHLTLFVVGMAVTLLVITLINIMWTPFLLERYRMDMYFLAAILCFVAIGLWHDTSSPKGQRRINFTAILLSAVTGASALVYCVYTIADYYPDAIASVGHMLFG